MSDRDDAPPKEAVEAVARAMRASRVRRYFGAYPSGIEEMLQSEPDPNDCAAANAVLLSRDDLPDAARRAKMFGHDCTLTNEEMQRLVARADGRCEVSGLPFSYASLKLGRGKMNPRAPSLDRIDSAKGYTPDNVRLVCWIVNAALGAWGDDAFWEMVEAAHAKRHG